MCRKSWTRIGGNSFLRRNSPNCRLAFRGSIGVPRGVVKTTGLRLGEALGLRWADIDLEDGKIFVRGTLRPQTLKLRGSDPRLALVKTKTAALRRTIAGLAFVLAALRQHQALGRDPGQRDEPALGAAGRRTWPRFGRVIDRPRPGEVPCAG